MESLRTLPVLLELVEEYSANKGALKHSLSVLDRYPSAPAGLCSG